MSKEAELKIPRYSFIATVTDEGKEYELGGFSTDKLDYGIDALIRELNQLRIKISTTNF